jgi:hypothetical protein
MKPRKGIVLLGIVTIILWASYVPYLVPLPFSLQPSIKKIARNIAEAPEPVKEKAGFTGKNQSEIEKAMMRKVVLIWLVKAIPILIGVLSGFFLIRRKNYGRIMALLVAASWIILNVVSYIRSANVWERFYAVYVTSLKERPRFVIHNDFLPLIVFLFTIFYLVRPSIVREFKDPSERSPVP